MSVDRIASYYAAGGGQGGHSTKSRSGWQQSNGVTPLTEGWAKYQRFAKEDVIWVDGPSGPVWLTRMQVRVLHKALAAIDNGTTSIRAIARDLQVSASTVSRAIVKLVAFGLLIAVKSLGRYAAMIILRVPTDGSLSRYRKAAKAKLQGWKLAAERRVSRLAFNVAPRDVLEEELPTTSTSSYRRNIEKWTPEELRSAGII